LWYVLSGEEYIAGEDIGGRGVCVIDNDVLSEYMVKVYYDHME